MKTLKHVIIVLLLLNTSCLLAQKKASYITGIIDKTHQNDTLTLIIGGPFYSYQFQNERFASQILKTTVDSKGLFKFKIQDVNSPVHVSLFLSNKRHYTGYLIGNGDIAKYLMLPGDSINITFDNKIPSFSGKGAALFEVQYKIEQMDKNQEKLKQNSKEDLRKNVKRWLHHKDSLLTSSLSFLETYKSKLTSNAYSIVRADVIASNRTFLYQAISFTDPFFISGKILTKDIAEVCEELQKRPAYFDANDHATLAPKYIYYLYRKLIMEEKYKRLINNNDVRLDFNYFSAINNQFRGILRDKLLAWWLIELSSINQLYPENIKNSLAVMETPVYIKMVKSLEETFTKGQPLTDFDFKDTKDKTVRLGDFKDKVVIIDLWFTGCSACVQVAKGMSFVENAFKNRSDVIFVSISIDRDKDKWLGSINPSSTGKHYVSPSTTYLYTAGTGDNNIFIKKYVPKGSYPCLLIIDKNNKIFTSTPTRPVTHELQLKLIDEINQALLSK